MIFSHCQLQKATDSFAKDKLIGKGGFGDVFQGRLRHSDVAIKVLNTVSCCIFVNNDQQSSCGVYREVYNQLCKQSMNVC